MNDKAKTPEGMLDLRDDKTSSAEYHVTRDVDGWQAVSSRPPEDIAWHQERSAEYQPDLMFDAANEKKAVGRASRPDPSVQFSVQPRPEDIDMGKLKQRAKDHIARDQDLGQSAFSALPPWGFSQGRQAEKFSVCFAGHAVFENSPEVVVKLGIMFGMGLDHGPDNDAAPIADLVFFGPQSRLDRLLACGEPILGLLKFL